MAAEDAPLSILLRRDKQPWGSFGVRVSSPCQGLNLCCFFCLFLMFFPWKTSACCSLMSACLYCHLLQMNNPVSLSD